MQASASVPTSYSDSKKAPVSGATYFHPPRICEWTRTGTSSASDSVMTRGEGSR